jgi:rhodanese-related sulfurtransferase
MRKLGFRNVYDMEGGFTSWQEKKYPVAGS